MRRLRRWVCRIIGHRWRAVASIEPLGELMCVMQGVRCDCCAKLQLVVIVLPPPGVEHQAKLVYLLEHTEAKLAVEGVTVRRVRELPG